MAERARTWARLLLGGLPLWRDLLVAVFELARARWWLGSRSGRELIDLGRRRPTLQPARGDPAAIAERVAYVVPRVAPRVPWRADCWVQALAAQAWLARAGIESDLVIGVRTNGPNGFEAHAWLSRGGRIVTGGDVSGFTPLVTSAPREPTPSSDPAS